MNRHTHPWVEASPGFYLHGDETALTTAPLNYRRVRTASGPRILAHGRDHNLPGWRDTRTGRDVADVIEPAATQPQLSGKIVLSRKADQMSHGFTRSHVPHLQDFKHASG
jgi:hypothetical protein